MDFKKMLPDNGEQTPNWKRSYENLEGHNQGYEWETEIQK